MVLTLFFILALALVPTLFYILLLWWLDRYEKEPLRLLVLAFVWGAVPTVILSIIVELLTDRPLTALDPTGTGLIGELAGVIITGPFIEEGFKAIIVFTLFLAFRREFDDVLDGIIYGAMVGLGFAFVENVLYGTGFAADGGIGGVIQGAFLRSVLFGLNHSLFTSVTGAALGAARYVRGPRRLIYPVLGFLGAWALHALHNGFASLSVLGDNAGCLGILAAVVVDWGFILVIVVVAALAVRKERGWIEQQLREEVQVGRLTGDEYQMLTSSVRRIGARWTALSHGGLRAYRAVNQLQTLATELAFRKQQVLVEHDPASTQYDIQLARARIDALKGLNTPPGKYY